MDFGFVPRERYLKFTERDPVFGLSVNLFHLVSFLIEDDFISARRADNVTRCICLSLASLIMAFPIV